MSPRSARADTFLRPCFPKRLTRRATMPYLGKHLSSSTSFLLCYIKLSVSFRILFPCRPGGCGAAYTTKPISYSTCSFSRETAFISQAPGDQLAHLIVVRSPLFRSITRDEYGTSRFGCHEPVEHRTSIRYGCQSFSVILNDIRLFISGFQFCFVRAIISNRSEMRSSTVYSDFRNVFAPFVSRDLTA